MAAEITLNPAHDKKHLAIFNLLRDASVPITLSNEVADRLLAMSDADMAALFRRIEEERNPREFAMAALLREAVDGWLAFDSAEEEVSGSDLVDWFDQWRVRAKAVLGRAL